MTSNVTGEDTEGITAPGQSANRAVRIYGFDAHRLSSFTAPQASVIDRRFVVRRSGHPHVAQTRMDHRRSARWRLPRSSRGGCPLLGAVRPPARLDGRCALLLGPTGRSRISVGNLVDDAPRPGVGPPAGAAANADEPVIIESMNTAGLRSRPARPIDRTDRGRNLSVTAWVGPRNRIGCSLCSWSQRSGRLQVATVPTVARYCSERPNAVAALAAVQPPLMHGAPDRLVIIWVHE